VQKTKRARIPEGIRAGFADDGKPTQSLHL